VFISGNKNQNGKIFMQMPDGKFTTLSDLEFGDESNSAISAATFLMQIKMVFKIYISQRADTLSLILKRLLYRMNYF
jgi:hypothetical protein